MMPSPTATTTRRGSFAGDGLAFSANAATVQIFTAVYQIL